LEVPFTLREVETSEEDEDGEAITTRVVDWQHGAAAVSSPPKDPWQQSRQQSQRLVALRLKRVLMAELAERGIDLPTGPNGPTVRMVDQEIVRGKFYDRTRAPDGTLKQKTEFKRQQLHRAISWAEEHELIESREVAGITYLWLTRPEPSERDTSNEF